MNRFIWLVNLALAIVLCVPASASDVERDSDGRQILRGTQVTGSFDNVRIIADDVGIYHSFNMLWVSNSVIEAPVCIETVGSNLKLSNNTFICDLCIKLTSGVNMLNEIYNNECSGQFSNR